MGLNFLKKITSIVVPYLIVDDDNIISCHGKNIDINIKYYKIYKVYYKINGYSYKSLSKLFFFF